jgi:hypothetical protein
MAIAFVATVVGAKALVDGGGSAATGMQELPDWPIVFELPGDCSWGVGRVSSLAHGDGRVATFNGQDARGISVSLQIVLQRLSQAATLKDALEEMAGGYTGWHNKMDIGPFDGVVSVSDEGGYGTEICAAGFDGERLGIVIVFKSASVRSAAMQTFRSLCGSIEYR